MKDGIYNVLSSLIKLSLNFLLIPILIRSIGIEAYGVWTFVSTTLAIVMLAEGGLSNSTLFFTSQAVAKEDDNQLSEVLSVVISAMLILATFAALSIAGIAPWVVQSVPALTKSQQWMAVICLQIGSVVAWIRMMQGISIGLEMACGQYGVMNLVTTLQSILTTIGMLIVSSLGGGIIHLMQWQLMTTAVGLIIHTYIAWSLIKSKKIIFKWNKDNSFNIFKYSVSVWLTSVGGAIFQQGDKLIVVNLLGSKELGIYAAITSITSQINSLSAMVIQPLLPKVSSMLENLDVKKTEVRREIKQAIQLNSAVAIGMGSILLIFDFTMMNMMFGRELKLEYIIDFRVAIAIYSIYSLNAVGYFLLLGSGMANLSFIATLSSGIISLSMIFLGASKMGLQGAVIGNSGYIMVWMLNFWAMKKFNISVREWFLWCYPLVLFVGVSCICNYVLLSENQILPKLALAVVEMLIIVAWLKNNQYEKQLFEK